MVPFETMEEVGGVSSSAEDWLLTYFAPNASMCFVGIQIAKPFPNNQSGKTLLRYNFFFFFFSIFFFYTFLALSFVSWAAHFSDTLGSTSFWVVSISGLKHASTANSVSALRLTLGVYILKYPDN